MRYISLLVSLFLGSCTPVYLPTPPSAPLVLYQGDIAVTGNLSTSALGNLSAAYCFIDNFSALAEMTFDPPSGERTDIKFSSANAALGYHTEVGLDWRADFYLGGGLGTTESRGDRGFFFNNFSDKLIRARFTNVLAQVDVGFVEDTYEGAYQIRGNYVMFNRFERINEEFGQNGNVTNVHVEYGHKDELFIENGFIFRFGTERLKFLTFANVTIQAGSKASDQQIHMPMSIGVGFQFRINAFDKPLRPMQ